MIERPVDFNRSRALVCGQCDARFDADLEWLDRWSYNDEACPGCGVTCEAEKAPRVTVDPHDAALDDSNVAQAAWYHTSTHPDWPTKEFNPARSISNECQGLMGGKLVVDQWVSRQRGKALHIGTYEAAIHNMLRRISGQNDGSRQFWLYRVHLKPGIRLRPGWITDPGDWVGDVPLTTVCPPGVDATRYLNRSEDPGGISLALGPTAIASTQQIQVPIPAATDPAEAARALAAFNAPPSTQPPPWALKLSYPLPPNARADHWKRARTAAAPLATQLPINLKSEFLDAASATSIEDPDAWLSYAQGLLDLVIDPTRTLAELDAQPARLVAP